MVCACFNTNAGPTGNALGATVTKMSSAYWRCIGDANNWAHIEASSAADAQNAMDLFETRYNDKYDDDGFVNYVTPYLAMVADNGNVVQLEVVTFSRRTKTAIVSTL